VVTAPIAVNSRGLDGPAEQQGRRRFKRAVAVAIGVVALGTSAAFLIGAIETWQVTPAGGAMARAQLPGDLFTAPRAPMPRVVVRYMAPRNTPSAPVAGSPMAPVAPSPTARPTPSGRPHPTPSPSPGGGGDD
jgi:hypothetical protein